MKKTMLLVACLFALALSASAQTLTFAALPPSATPTKIPNGYGQLNWAGFSYVDPIWAGAGPGFKVGPDSLDVGFMGGGLCELPGVSCSASISAKTSNANAVGSTFLLKSAIVAAGYHNEIINVSAYRDGIFVGSKTYDLTTSLQTIPFPDWGAITELVVDTNQGTVVFYSLDMQLAAANASSGASAQVKTCHPRKDSSSVLPCPNSN